PAALLQGRPLLSLLLRLRPAGPDGRPVLPRPLPAGRHADALRPAGLRPAGLWSAARLWPAAGLRSAARLWSAARLRSAGVRPAARRPAPAARRPAARARLRPTAIADCFCPVIAGQKQSASGPSRLADQC